MKKLILLLNTVKGIHHGRHCGVIGNTAEKKHSNIQAIYFLQNDLKKVVTKQKPESSEILSCVDW